MAGVEHPPLQAASKPITTQPQQCVVETQIAIPITFYECESFTRHTIIIHRNVIRHLR